MSDNELRLRLQERVAHGIARHRNTPSSRSEPATDWRVGLQVEDGRRPSATLANMTVADALGAALITLDSGNQGVPRSAAWTLKAIELLAQADTDEQAEIEQCAAELDRERDLRAERQRLADQALSDYLALRRRETQPGVSRVFEALGRTFHVQDDQPAVPMAGMILGEADNRPGTSEVARAYYTWQDRLSEVAAGPEDDRRTFRRADGADVLRETALVERIGHLRSLVGVRQSRMAQLQDHLERLGAPPEPPQRIVVKDERGSESWSVLPARLARRF